MTPTENQIENIAEEYIDRISKEQELFGESTKRTYNYAEMKSAIIYGYKITLGKNPFKKEEK